MSHSDRFAPENTGNRTSWAESTLRILIRTTSARPQTLDLTLELALNAKKNDGPGFWEDKGKRKKKKADMLCVWGEREECNNMGRRASDGLSQQ